MDTNTKPTDDLADDDQQLFLIPLLVGILRWIEELITALSGYGITAALVIGVVDLLSNGQFSSQVGWIDLAYAWAMALGIAGQIVGLSSRSSRSFKRGQWPAGLAYGALVLTLAGIEYQAGVIFGFHKSFGTPVTQSLADLGISARGFIEARTGTAVALAILSGFLRWQKPTRRKSIAQEEAESAEKIRRAEIKRQERAAMFGNITGLVGDAAKSARQATVAALADSAKPTENAHPAARTVQTASNGHDASSRLPKLPQDYTADDPAFERYELPNGITLTSMYSLSEMARLLGIAKSTLSTAWSSNDMEYEVATGDQPSTAMNLQVYQVLALVETGNLNTPANVRVLVNV